MILNQFEGASSPYKFTTGISHFMQIMRLFSNNFRDRSGFLGEISRFFEIKMRFFDIFWRISR